MTRSTVLPKKSPKTLLGLSRNGNENPPPGVEWNLPTSFPTGVLSPGDGPGPAVTWGVMACRFATARTSVVPRSNPPRSSNTAGPLVDRAPMRAAMSLRLAAASMKVCARAASPDSTAASSMRVTSPSWF